MNIFNMGMNTFSLRFVVAALLAMLAGSAGGQRDDRTFQARDGYEEARFGSQEVTIKTRDGTRTLRVSLAKLRVAQTAKVATIKLPGAGLALLQHAAGSVKLVAGGERFEPLEGEWLRLPLPAEVGIGTDNDTILLDLILIQE
jgi:hypothetical protein